jgi:adenylate kinase
MHHHSEVWRLDNLSLATYHKETEPLKDFYAARGKLVTVEGQNTVAETTDVIKKALGIE